MQSTGQHDCDRVLTFIGCTGKLMKARVKWVQDATFLGESGSGHAVVMDGPEDHGGRNLGVRPMEMLLLVFCSRWCGAGV